MIQFNRKYCRITFYTKIRTWIMSLLCLLPLDPAVSQGLSPYSTRQLEELEREFIQQINLSDSVERNPLASQYINSLGKRLAYSSHIKKPYFFIVKSREINAFAGPGGYIGINTELILTSSNESELAAVMAHEIAHVRLHHLYNMIEHEKQMRIPMLASLLASIALGVLNPTLGMGALMGSLSGINQSAINFTRANEKEADRIGIDMLIKAGFNPESMAAFFKKMQEHSRYFYTANIPAILRSHPLDYDRIAEAQNRTQHLKIKPVNNSLDYSLFKELIRVEVALEPIQLLNFYTQLCNKHNTSIACQYGHARALLKTNQPQKAHELLKPLLQDNQNNLYIQIAVAETEIRLMQFNAAITRLAELHTNFPDNYAALMAYAQGLTAANQAQKATSILLKGSRVYKQDLPLCRALARAQAITNQKSYAYFTQAHCLLLEGQRYAAINQLRVARNLAKKDAYLSARIDAKINEIKQSQPLS